MTAPEERRGGRPRASSRRTLEEAASELFLERGYAQTSIDDIARRAGLGRASVFNYVTAKSDLLWLDADDLLDGLERRLAEGEALLDALRATAAEAPPAVPLALTEQALLGAREEIVGSGMLRVARLAALLASASPGPAAADAARRARAFVLAGAVAAAWVSWGRAGVGRGPLLAYLDDALAHAQLR